MNLTLVLSVLLVCSVCCGSSSKQDEPEHALLDTIGKSQSPPRRRRPKIKMVKKDSDWGAWNRDTATGRVFFLIDDTSAVLKDMEKLMKRAENFAFYIQGRKWCGKPIKIAIFSRKPPIPVPDMYYYDKVGRGMYIKKKEEPPPWPKPNYEYVGNENEIASEYKEEWKNRYIADYDCEADTITFFPANKTKMKSVSFYWKGHRLKGGGRVRPGEENPNALFKLDTIR